MITDTGIVTKIKGDCQHERIWKIQKTYNKSINSFKEWM